MEESLSLRFLYKTVVGRGMLKVLIHPAISRAVGRVLSLPISKPMISYYVRKYHIDMTGIDIPTDGFSSFNEFFMRKKKEDVKIREGKTEWISPCEGFLTVLDIKKDMILDVKNAKYTLYDLLKDKKLAEKFEDGKALIFRLTPANYHRYCYVADGKVLASRKIKGKLHCVRPIALRTIPVFAQNSREYEIIKTKDFGGMIQMEVGALCVGKIANEPIQTKEIKKGMEKGHFEFGGSTIILLFQKDKISIEEKYLGREEEIPVDIGEVLGSRFEQEK